MSEPIYTRDVSSGRFHKRYRTRSGRLSGIDADNLDQAGAYEVVDADVIANADPEALCKNCWPEGPDDSGGSSDAGN